MVDLNELLERTGGDEDLVQEILSIFIEEDCPLQMQQLARGLETNDRELAQRSAHTLKGSVSNFETGAVHELSLAIEQATRAGDLARARELFPALEQAVHDLLPELQAHRA